MACNWLALAFTVCLRVCLLNFAAARMLPSNSSSCYCPPLQSSSSKHLHIQVLQKGASLNPQGKESLSSHGQPPASTKTFLDHSKIEVLKEAGGHDTYRGSKNNGHVQNTTRRDIRLLMGRLGSMPPSCVQRCSGCLPCKPVHVPIQRGRKRIGLLEYYPEAWRCKCKNKLYMPGSSTVP